MYRLGSFSSAPEAALAYARHLGAAAASEGGGPEGGAEDRPGGGPEDKPEGAPGGGGAEGAKVRVSQCGAGHALEAMSAWCGGGTCDVCQRGVAEGEDI